MPCDPTDSLNNRAYDAATADNAAIMRSCVRALAAGLRGLVLGLAETPPRQAKPRRDIVWRQRNDNGWVDIDKLRHFPESVIWFVHD